LLNETFSIDLIQRFAINLASVIILIRLVYFRYYRKTDLFLSFFGFNVIIFLISYLLNKVNMTMGAAFGLFAVFSILRIRTEGINTKDMTYLFMAISIGLITAVGNGNIWQIGLINLIITLLAVLIDGSILLKKEEAQLIEYDNLELIKPEKRQELFVDIEKRTGLKIHRIEFISIDLLKDSALFNAFYYRN
jgi:Domain of unknown function (DUF4956)